MFVFLVCPGSISRYSLLRLLGLCFCVCTWSWLYRNCGYVVDCGLRAAEIPLWGSDVCKAKFTYIGRETRFITKAFKNTKVRIAFTTDNTTKNLLTTRATQHRNKYDKSGVYQLECPSCNKKYIGQTGRPFKTRYQEHYRDYKHGSMKSKFAQHLLENQHHIDSIDNIVDILHINNKEKMDTIEKFYIYRETKLNSQINDKLTVKAKVIFETLV